MLIDMKIMFLIDQMQSGGAARVVSILAEGLRDYGYNVTICTDNINYPVFYPINNQIKIISWHRYKTFSKSKCWFSQIQNILIVRKVLKILSPDIVIAEMSQPSLWSGVASWGTKIKVISHDHTSFKRKISFWDDVSRQYFYYFTNALVILSRKDQKLLKKKYPHKHVIYNPLPFLPLKDNSFIRRKNILCVGRFDVWNIKGFDLIINIFHGIHETHQDWKLEFAGTGKPESIRLLKKMVYEAGISDKVVFHGQVNEIKRLYQQTSIFALPSRVEGLPMALIEAMSQGCACVAFELEGVSHEIITDTHSGYVVKDGDLDAFSQRLCSLMESTKILKEISENGIRESKKFSLPVIIKEWNKLINNLL